MDRVPVAPIVVVSAAPKRVGLSMYTVLSTARSSTRVRVRASRPAQARIGVRTPRKKAGCVQQYVL